MKNNTLSDGYVGGNQISDYESVPTPLNAYLKLKIKEDKLIAELTVKNISENNVYLDKNDLGGESLDKPAYAVTCSDPVGTLLIRNLPKDIKSKHIAIKPDENITIETDMTYFYDFKQRLYGDLFISYSSIFYVLDKNYSVLTVTKNNKNYPLQFLLQSNKIHLTKYNIEKKFFKFKE